MEHLKLPCMDSGAVMHHDSCVDINCLFVCLLNFLSSFFTFFFFLCLLSYLFTF